MTSDATLRQNRASHPERSTWVSANAGSGKTRVLTDRVARLLLADQAPHKILCLTYTKAAAAEMQNRLFERLGKWAMMPDDELRRELDQIGETGQAYTVEALTQTRTHFARALETPGGLKIQTIHAFCASLLRRFPTEAGVSPQFREMEEGQATLLRETVLEDMARDDDLTAFDALARNLTNEDALNKILLDLLKHKDAFSGFDRKRTAQLVRVDPDLTVEQIHDDAMRMIEQDISEALIQYLGQSKDTEMKAGKALVSTRGLSSSAAIAALEIGFLTKKDKTPIKKGLPGKPTKDNYAAFAEALERIKEIIFDAHHQVRAVRALDKAQDLHLFAQTFIARYEAAKSVRGLLDFDDLIARTRALLSTREMTAWVLYRIDNGINHILVDEAQDTSPGQWELINALTQEFTDGLSAAPENRTLFVVGDKKQSIFGFQGADPNAFIQKELDYRAQFDDARKSFETVSLPTSFRSAAPILQLVDSVFSDDTAALGGPPTHESLQDTPGRVDLWAFDENDEKQETPPWYEPVDTIPSTSKVTALAQKTAETIRDMIGQPIHTKAGTRAITPGDILILVRSRSHFFHKVIDALKVANIAVAGADRMKIGEQLSVRDLTSLMRFLDNERDDLSLAEALRSPILGMTEAELFYLAQPREGTLWQALRTTEHSSVAILQDLRQNLDFIRPYELLDRVLTHHKGRQNLIARLGPECEDPIDELLAQSIAFEAVEAPSLGAFLHWLSARDVEVKRDMEAGQDEVRVMTVHGAKGLEAPIVFVPDTTEFNTGTKKPAIDLLDGIPIWTQPKGAEPEALAEIEKERAEREKQEYARLLYVALTRAENWLIVSGAGRLQANATHRWHPRVSAAMQALGAARQEDGTLTLTHKWKGEFEAQRGGEEGETSLPDWLHQKPDAMPRPARTISPSEFKAPHALPGEVTLDGRERGDAVHRLLEVLPGLPENEWAAIAARVAAEFDHEALLAEISPILKGPEFKHIFSADTLIEVPLAAHLPERDIAISGRIDRLILSEDEVLAVDFKSNQMVPETPEETPLGILAQQGAYASALAQIYPDRRIQTAIIWTRSAKLMTLPHALVIEALKTVTLP